MIEKSTLVLITTATMPPQGVHMLEMTNISKRKITAKAAVFFWAALGVNKIVIADATGQTLLDDKEILELNQMSVEVEQIFYLQNKELVINKGKGYGEGALIKFALQNSKFLMNANNFFKCTGKVYCRNFLEIVDMIEKNAIQNIFWREVFDNSIDTRFFYASKRFSENFLLPAYEDVDDKNHNMAEISVLKMAHQHLTQGSSIRPMLSGFSGSEDRPYFDSSLGFLDHNLPCWASQ
jgi:hypothetical protein